MSANTFPFRRISDPVIIGTDVTATQCTIDANFFTTGTAKGATQFMFYNPNLFPVRLKGSGNSVTGIGAYSPVTSTTGWCFPPGLSGPFTTQYPKYMSTLGVDGFGATATAGRPCEVWYGLGA